jgi:hypothetical protein
VLSNQSLTAFGLVRIELRQASRVVDDNEVSAITFPFEVYT